jgi:hypothetical protein
MYRFIYVLGRAAASGDRTNLPIKDAQPRLGGRRCRLASER